MNLSSPLLDNYYHWRTGELYELGVTERKIGTLTGSQKGGTFETGTRTDIERRGPRDVLTKE